MADIFGGTIGFDIYEPQKIAIEAGKSAASAFSGGQAASASKMNAGTNQQQMGLEKQKFQMQQEQMGEMTSFLKLFESYQ